ncbi:MAG: rhamnulokinase [Lachnospiraceae bacterium]|nr:rhamnulokinase [Lachnospiraceae bacterium]
MEYYLAIDIGASSGRHILGWMEKGKLKTREVYRFDNGMREVDGSRCWDINHLRESVIEGMKECKRIGKIPSYMGIDTWAVDYVLLDSEDNILGKTYGYRDSRTEGMDKLVYDIIPEEDLYGKTGIQKQIFNTIYQLMAHKTQEPELFAKAEDMLMIPDYLNFVLTGIKHTEYSNATTTQLVNAITGQWDIALIRSLGFPEKIFKGIFNPGNKVGTLSKEMEAEVGYNLTVMLAATHDTASAVLAVPYKNEGIYISSGTWSLMGTELMCANCTEKSRKLNYTNEGGFGRRYRYLKNIMGLWMIQSVRNELGREYSFAQMCEMAEEEKEFASTVDVNDQSFLAPDSMIQAIKDYCQKSGQQVPETVGQIAKVVYTSLSQSYAQTALELEEISGKKYDEIYIVGGGCNAEYLNKLTAKATGKIVYAGPSEATAIGNIMAQMIGTGRVEDIAEARRIIFESSDIKEYRP